MNIFLQNFSPVFFLILLGMILLLFLFFGYLYYSKLREKNRFLEQERNDLLDKLDMVQGERELNRAREEEREKNREHLVFEKVEKLEHAREKFEEEQVRVRKKDEDIQKKREENFSRMWNDHENSVLVEIKNLCQKRDIGFLVYENTNLPGEFSGTLKPDAMISFLDQYIIFDAKKSKNPRSYIESQVKLSAQKYKNSENSDLIYKTVFFVMPEDEVSQLEKKQWYEEGYYFYVISISALLPTLAMLKKITAYANIKDFNPQDRENIVHILAKYEQHITFQNAQNRVLEKKSEDIIEEKKTLPKAIQEELDTKKSVLKALRCTPLEIKKYL